MNNYNEPEITEHVLGIIKQKREEGFTNEQIAKDLGFPAETVRRVNTDDVLPENPNESEELPMDNNVISRDEKIKETPESENNKERLDVKGVYSLEEAFKDFTSNDRRKKRKAEYCIIQYMKEDLENYIKDVGDEKDVFLADYRLYFAKSSTLETMSYLLGQELDYFTLIDKYKNKIVEDVANETENKEEAEENTKEKESE